MSPEWKRLIKTLLWLVPRFIIWAMIIFPLWVIGWIVGFAVEEIRTGMHYGKKHNEELFWKNPPGEPVTSNELIEKPGIS